jgi:hypothetical protein
MRMGSVTNCTRLIQRRCQKYWSTAKELACLATETPAFTRGHQIKCNYLGLVNVEAGVGDAEEGVRLGDAKERDVVVLEDVPRVHVLDVAATEVVQLLVLDDGVGATTHD